MGRHKMLPGLRHSSVPYAKALCTLPFQTTSAFFFRTFHSQTIFFTLTSIPFFCFRACFICVSFPFSRRIPCITLTSSGTQSSGLVCQASQCWTHSRRRNNASPSHFPLPPCFPRKHVSFKTFEKNTLTFPERAGSGNPSSLQTANPLPSTSAHFHARTEARPQPPFNWHATTPSQRPIQAPFGSTRVTIPSAPATPSAQPPHPLLNSIV